MNILIQFGQNLKFGQEFGLQKQKSTSDDSKHPRWRIAAMYVSKYVSKGLAAEVQARPLRKESN